jgi:hypothetical protein
MNNLICIVLLSVLWLGCQKAPSKLDIARKEVQLVERYLRGSAEDAKAAMLELESYIHQCQGAGSRGMDFDQAYAAVYSRLHLVGAYLQKPDLATSSYKKATACWQRFSQRGGQAQLTPEEIRERIEGVDRFVGRPAWKPEK